MQRQRHHPFQASCQFIALSDDEERARCPNKVNSHTSHSEFVKLNVHSRALSQSLNGRTGMGSTGSTCSIVSS